MNNNIVIVNTLKSLLEIKSKELSDYKTFGLEKKLISTLSFKVKNLKTVISLLEVMTEPITNASALAPIKGIGKSTARKNR